MTDKRKQDDDQKEQKNEKNEKNEESKRSYPIVCTLCGEKARVPFKPRRDQKVFCPDCFKFKREEINKKKQRQSPRKKHGTRVTFPIVCAQCGTKETLDYVPKGVALHEVMCSECVRAEHGEKSRWAQIRQTKESEQQAEWSFDCAECGREDYLKFEPKPDQTYLCGRCYDEQEAPSRERLEGKKRVDEAVFIRKSDDKSDEDS